MTKLTQEQLQTIEDAFNSLPEDMRTVNKVRKVISDALDSNELYCNWNEYKGGVKVFVPIKGEEPISVDIRKESYV